MALILYLALISQSAGRPCQAIGKLVDDLEVELQTMRAELTRERVRRKCLEERLTQVR